MRGGAIEGIGCRSFYSAGPVTPLIRQRSLPLFALRDGFATLSAL
jgi:hypothetical protein